MTLNANIASLRRQIAALIAVFALAMGGLIPSGYMLDVDEATNRLTIRICDASLMGRHMDGASGQDSHDHGTHIDHQSTRNTSHHHNALGGDNEHDHDSDIDESCVFAAAHPFEAIGQKALSPVTDFAKSHLHIPLPKGRTVTRQDYTLLPARAPPIFG